jgi:hypothetical protein
MHFHHVDPRAALGSMLAETPPPGAQSQSKGRPHSTAARR